MAAVSFLILIPIFAALYLGSSDGGFFQATTVYEAQFSTQEAQVADILSELFERPLQEVVENNEALTAVKSSGGFVFWRRFETDSRYIYADAEFVNALHLAEDPAYVLGKDEPGTIGTFKSADVTFDMQDVTPDSLTRIPYTIANVEEPYRSRYPVPASLLETPSTLFLEPYESEALVRYWLASQGRPEALDGLGSRMLLLSAATATVGSTDIVPISPLTRTLVTLQSLLSVLTVGWFINAMWHSAVNRRGPQSNFLAANPLAAQTRAALADCIQGAKVDLAQQQSLDTNSRRVRFAGGSFLLVLGYLLGRSHRRGPRGGDQERRSC